MLKNNFSETSHVKKNFIINLFLLLIKGYCCAVKIDDGHNLGPSMFHAYECGAGISLFLKVRECEAFVLRYHQRGRFQIIAYILLGNNDPIKISKPEIFVLYCNFEQKLPVILATWTIVI